MDTLGRWVGIIVLIGGQRESVFRKGGNGFNVPRAVGMI